MLEIAEFNFLVWVGIFAALGGLWFYYVIKPGKFLAGLRAVVFILIIILLLQPVHLVREHAQGKPVCAVMIDNSKSMSVKDPEERLGRIRKFVSEHISSWRKNADIKLYLFAKTTSRTSEEAIDAWQAHGDSTHISHALSEIDQELAGKLSGVLCISDGQDNGSLDPQETAGNLNVPVYTVSVGSSEHMKDILISNLEAGDFAFKNTPVSVRAVVRGYGFGGQKIPVRLYKHSELLSTREVVIAADGSDTAVGFTIIPKNIGSFSYRITVPQYPGEASNANNQVDFSIDVIREKLRVLYICGQPGYEYAFLREALKSDPAVELVSFVILRNPENVAFVVDDELSLIPFPAREIFLEKLFSFDLLIFENFTYVRFGIIAPFLENIRKFVVEKGGAFIMIGGPNSFGLGQYAQTPIEELLPVRIRDTGEVFKLQSFQLKPNSLKHPVMNIADTHQKNKSMWESLPRLAGYNVYGEAKEGAVVLGEHPTEKSGRNLLPILTVWEKGKGRVMAMATNTTWRWAMGLASEGKTAFGYTRFWRSAVRWLTQAEEMKLVLITLDKRQFAPGETMHIKIMVKDEAYDPLAQADIALHITGPDGVKREIPSFPGDAGEYHAEYEPWEIGTYHLSAEARNAGKGTFIGTDKRKLDVLSFSKENVELNVNEKLLMNMAARSGGKYSGIETFNHKEFFKSLKIRHRGEILKKNPIWNNPLIFGLIIILLAVEWYIRRVRGLP
ncbi:MAG: glutamine amidotransferase [bacterium]